MNLTEEERENLIFSITEECFNAFMDKFDECATKAPDFNLVMQAEIWSQTITHLIGTFINLNKHLGGNEKFARKMIDKMVKMAYEKSRKGYKPTVHIHKSALQ